METQESAPLPVWVCKVLQSMAAQASVKGKEECGLIALHEDMHVIVEIPNTSEQPDNFRMSSQDLLDAWSVYGDGVVGCWHTHKESEVPSVQDREYAPPGLRYWIATEDVVVEYDMSYSNPTVVHRWPNGG